MIYLSEVIKRMRTNCPSFQGRVGGTATFGAVMEAGQSSDLALPHAFVIPVREENITGQDQHIGDDTERRRETFATVICVDNSVARGIGTAGVLKITAIDELRRLQQEMEDAWNDWVPRQKFDVITFVRAEHMGMDNKRLWHEFRWSTDYTNFTAPTDEESDVMEEEVRWITEGEPQPRPHTETIIMGYEPDRNIEDPASVQDFFLPLAPLPPEPTPEALAAAIARADAVIDVPHH